MATITEDGTLINWEERKFETAKAVLQGFYSNSRVYAGINDNATVKRSIEIADLFIQKYKESHSKK